MMMLSRLPASSRRRASGDEPRARQADSTVADSPPVGVTTGITPSSCEMPGRLAARRRLDRHHAFELRDDPARLLRLVLADDARHLVRRAVREAIWPVPGQ